MTLMIRAAQSVAARTGRRAPRRWRSVAVASIAATSLTAAGLVAGGAATGAVAGASSSKVLLVGTYDGHKGQYTSIQAAVNAAAPGDWILIAPGDYHEHDAKAPSKSRLNTAGYAGVLVTTPDLHIRGMDRNTVVVDGTKAGSPECSSTRNNQFFGPDGDGTNGIEVFRTNDVWIQNLTVCNYLSGTKSSGNEIWWNGVPTVGPIGLHGYWGTYLTATSTYFGGEHTAAAYGIFSSNASGGSWNEDYASNMNDSGTYVGACKRTCTVTIDNSWFEYDALGYSGTNSGGQVIVENSKFDHNQDGFDTNSAISGDPPAPQTGRCPHTGISKITHTHSCWVFIHNVSEDNNTGDVPAAGSAAAGPIGTGMTISGGRYDTVMDNTFATNGAWGNLFVPYPTSGKPSTHQTCTKIGGVATDTFKLGCVLDPEGDTLLDNTYVHDGFFGNPTNGDFGEITLDTNQPQNCFGSNTDPDGSSPSTLQTTQPVATCGKPSAKSYTGTLLTQALCDSGFAKTQCTATDHYPSITTDVTMQPLPSLPSMPDPCQGVPANAWCPSKS